MSERPATNMVFFKADGAHPTTDEQAARLVAVGVKVLPIGAWLQAVTHYGTEAEDFRQAAGIIRRTLASD